jgi:hypothetical protein
MSGKVWEEACRYLVGQYAQDILEGLLACVQISNREKIKLFLDSEYLQLRGDWVEILHPKVYYFNILQVRVSALFILQAKVLSVAVPQLRVLGLEV